MDIATFADDAFSLSDFKGRLESFIDVERKFVEGSLVVALSSPFGTGKSTFLRMWKDSLDNAGEEESKPVVVSLNAWKGDYFGDPLFAIITGLVDQVQPQDGGEKKERVIEAAKDLAWLSYAVANQAAKKFTGLDPDAARKFAEEKKAERTLTTEAPLDAFSRYQSRMDAMSRLSTAIVQFVDASRSNVIFVVDELDRCRPNYAVEFLETIKHIFQADGASFVLAIDREQLENSVKTAFGPGLDFNEYLRKFVHREIDLPAISDIGYREVASKYVPIYLKRAGVRGSYLSTDRDGFDRIVNVIAAMKLTPRQIQEVFRIVGHYFAASEEQSGTLRHWCFEKAAIAMSAFRVGAPKLYRSLGQQRIEPEAAGEYLRDFFGERDSEHWFAIFLTGGLFSALQGMHSEEAFSRAGFSTDDSNSTWSNVPQFQAGWGHSSNGLRIIYESLESLTGIR